MKKNYRKPTIESINLKNEQLLTTNSCTEDQGSEHTCTSEYSCPGDTL